ncbi:hypothetical protein I4F81_009056 [Pyropia yezoensis]|uniref:Uncharacterized protein n=1 Tax=Pyropia yezoensis TaxID=2788 RepID=A0ACC3C987_PYRYE|nr:hypothetical protein I4F81_009056 [Neopyropia yezoensis]
MKVDAARALLAVGQADGPVPAMMAASHLARTGPYAVQLTAPERLSRQAYMQRKVAERDPRVAGDPYTASATEVGVNLRRAAAAAASAPGGGVGGGRSSSGAAARPSAAAVSAATAAAAPAAAAAAATADAARSWATIPVAERTEETERELRILGSRKALDPKRFYKATGTTTGKRGKWAPDRFHVGTVVAPAAEFFSARLARRERHDSFAGELLADGAFLERSERKVGQIWSKQRSGLKRGGGRVTKGGGKGGRR